ncbi:glycosyltransferase family 4 protein [Methanoculleus sp. UBA208]|uniref:glycosyltransferase family 4 protein n=1 Tax=Methanoculleus sp. UBA208 TaxID=1915494 RepID=UPI0025E7F64C|nr:glycosyltransferase family 4 protein [Methanoculleus sp. UBA208]
MKLLVCTTEYFPHGAGIANVVYNIVEQLTGRGFECTVCSPTGPDIRLGSWPLIEKAGVIGLLNYWYQVSRHFKDNDYDAVWLQNPFIVTKNPFARCLVTMHSTYYGSSAQGVGDLHIHIYESVVARIERSCLTRMPPNTLFTGVGQPVREELERIGVAGDRITYIPNGVDVRHFRPSPDKKVLRKRFGIPADGTVLLSVGRLTPAKRPFTMLEAFSQIGKKRRDVTLCIAGGGELLEATRDLAQRMGLKNVLFLGHVDHDRDLPDLYACADYYIMTSQYEGGMPPLTLAEAMASGVPCIVSDIPNLGVVNEAGCGRTISFDDAARAGDEILRYLDEEHPDHGANARRYAEEVLNWDALSARYARIFECLAHEIPDPGGGRTGTGIVSYNAD